MNKVIKLKRDTKQIHGIFRDRECFIWRTARGDWNIMYKGESTVYYICASTLHNYSYLTILEQSNKYKYEEQLIIDDLKKFSSNLNQM